MRYSSNPAAPGYGGGTNAPFNFMNYQPSSSGAASPSSPGIGSNQYGSLPPWMNTAGPSGGGSVIGGGQGSTGGYMPWQPAWGPNPPAFQQIPGIGSWMQNQLGQQQAPTQQQLMNQASSSPAYAATRQQLLNQIPGGSLVSNPTTFQLMHDIMGTNIPITNPQGGAWAMGTPQQELMAQGANLWQPLSSQYQMPQGNPSTTPNWGAQQAQQAQQAQNNMLNQFAGGGQQNPFPQWGINNMFQQWMGGQTGQQSIPAASQMAQMQQNPIMQMLYQMMGRGGFGNMGQVNY